MNVALSTRLPAIAFTTTILAEITTAAFEGYIVPLSFTAESFDARFRREDLDRVGSPVFIVDGSPVAIVLVARRGWTARIAAMGVLPRPESQSLLVHIDDGDYSSACREGAGTASAPMCHGKLSRPTLKLTKSACAKGTRKSMATPFTLATKSGLTAR